MLSLLVSWLRQPTSVAGIAAIFGTASAMLSGQLTTAQAIPVLVGAAASILLPDNTHAASSMRDAAQAILDKSIKGKS